MTTRSTSKLKKGSFVPTKVIISTNTPQPVNPVEWNHLNIAPISQALLSGTHPQILWKILTQTMADAFPEYAIALTQKLANGKIILLAHDGIHESLSHALSTSLPELPPPPQYGHSEHHHLTNHDHPEIRRTLCNRYEFINHCWQWNIHHTPQTIITLALFGADDSEQATLAQHAVKLARYIAYVSLEEKARHQNASEMMALLQGLNKTPSDILISQLNAWHLTDG